MDFSERVLTYGWERKEGDSNGAQIPMPGMRERREVGANRGPAGKEVQDEVRGLPVHVHPDSERGRRDEEKELMRGLL